MSKPITFELNKFKTILIDCDGVLWRSSEVIRNSNKAVIKLRNHHYNVAFLTNNSVYTRKAFLNKLNELGFEASENECFCGAYFTALYLKAHSITKTAYIIGSVGLAEEISNQGIKARLIDNSEDFSVDDESDDLKDIGSVIVGLDKDFGYMKLSKAAHFLRNSSVKFIGTNPDPCFPSSPTRFSPCTGSLIASVETASGRPPTLLGKPSKELFDLVQRAYGFDPLTTCMVGDRMDTDILFALNGGIRSVLVFSGVTTREYYHSMKIKISECPGFSPKNFYQADFEFDDFSEFVDQMLS